MKDGEAAVAPGGGSSPQRRDEGRRTGDFGQGEHCDLRGELCDLRGERLRAVARETRELWGDGRSEDDYFAYLEAQRERGGGRVVHLGLMEGGRALASLKRYSLRLASNRGSVRGLGLGAVFTSPAVRRRGLAERLISRVLDEAQRSGAACAVLFSDIEPDYYERLGFRRQESTTWSASTADLPGEGALALRVPASDDELVGVHQRCMLRSPVFRPWRDGEAQRFGEWKNGPYAARLLFEGEVPRGYALVARAGETLWLGDVATDGVPSAVLFATLRALGRQASAQRVAGWLYADDVAGGPFVASPRRECVPMVRWLDPSLGDARAHFAPMDHF